MFRGMRSRGVACLAGALLLVVLRPALDGRPAKRVHVRWAPTTAGVERVALEDDFSLRLRREDGRTVVYDLVDPSPSNIRALLRHPAVEDTEGIDRSRAMLKPTAEDGVSRTGLAWRIGAEGAIPYVHPLALALAVAGAGMLLRGRVHVRLPVARMVRQPRRRAAAVLGAGVLLIASQPLLDGGRAKYIHVRWAPAVTDSERAALQDDFNLRMQMQDGRTFGYDLLDASPRNVSALLQHAAVEDTEGFDRAQLQLKANVNVGRSRTGPAWRYRVEWIVPLVVVIGLLMVRAGGLALLRERSSGLIGQALEAVTRSRQRRSGAAAAIGVLLLALQVVLEGSPLRPYLIAAGALLVLVHGSILLHDRFAGTLFLPADATGRVSTRILEVDALRGIAALAVVLYHYTIRFGLDFHQPASPIVTVPLGHYGVELFFVISGLVILMTLERSRSGWDFVLARAGRLYPPYWAAMTLTFAALVVFGLPDAVVTPAQYGWNLTMLQRFDFIDVADVDGVYWSLQVELAFYALMLTIATVGALPAIEVVLLVWVAILALDGRWQLLDLVSAHTLARELITLFGYAELFVVGMAMHLWRSRGLSPGIAATIVAAVGWRASHVTTEATIVMLAIVAAFVLVVRGRARWLAAGPLLFLGAVSYPLYLIHQNLGYMLLRALYGAGVETNIAIVVTVAAAIAAATMIHFAIEVPAQRLVSRLRHAVPRFQAAVTTTRLSRTLGLGSANAAADVQ